MTKSGGLMARKNPSRTKTGWSASHGTSPRRIRSWISVISQALISRAQNATTATERNATATNARESWTRSDCERGGGLAIDGRGELVPGPVRGQDNLWLPRIGLDLLAQILDVCVDGALKPFKRIAIDAVDQLQTGKDLPGMAGQDFQQSPLRGRQMTRLSTSSRVPAAKVNSEVADLENIPALVTIATEHRPYAGDHFTGAERFRHIIIRPELQPADLVVLTIARGQHDDRNGHQRPDPARYFPAVQVGQHQV